MGFENSANANSTFFRIKDGKFVKGKDGQEETFTRFTGTITKLGKKTIVIKATGKEFDVLTVSFKDSAGTYQLSTPFDEGYASTFLSALKNADLSKPVTLSPSVLENPGKDGKTYASNFLNIFQNDVHVKMYYLIKGEGDKQMPRVNWVKIGKANHKDNTNLVNFLEALVNAYNSQIAGDAPVAAPQAVVEDKEVVDDLPF